jgi:hypothetical protein
VIADIRHTWEYAEVLRRSGLAEVKQTGSGITAVVLKVFTFGSLQPGTVTGQKAEK